VTQRVSYLLGTHCKHNQQETLVRLAKESVTQSMISQTFSGSSMLTGLAMSIGFVCLLLFVICLI